jgi:hypothetical protein
MCWTGNTNVVSGEYMQISYSRERVHLRELDIYGRVMLKWILEEQGVLNWIRIGFNR